MSGCGHACRACADSRRRRSLVPLSLAPIPVDGDRPDWHTAQDWVAVATERVGELAGGHSRLCGRLWHLGKLLAVEVVHLSRRREAMVEMRVVEAVAPR